MLPLTAGGNRFQGFVFSIVLSVHFDDTLLCLPNQALPTGVVTYQEAQCAVRQGLPAQFRREPLIYMIFTD